MKLPIQTGKLCRLNDQDSSTNEFQRKNRYGEKLYVKKYKRYSQYANNVQDDSLEMHTCMIKWWRNSREWLVWKIEYIIHMVK